MKWVRSDIPKGEVEESKPAETSQPSAEVRYLRKRVRPAKLSEYEVVPLKRRKYTKSQKKISKTNQETENNKENKAKESSTKESSAKELVAKKESGPCVIRCHQNRVLVNRRLTFPPIQNKHQTAILGQEKGKWIDANLLYNYKHGRTSETVSNLPVWQNKNYATNEIAARNHYVHPMELFQQKLKNIRNMNSGASKATIEHPHFIPLKLKKKRNRIEEILAMQSDRLNDSQFEIYESVILFIANSIN